MLPTAFNIKATNLTLTPELRGYVERRFESLAGLLDFNDPTLKVQIEVGRTTRHHDKGEVYRAEFNVRLRRGSFRSVAEGATIQAAIDDAREALETNLERAKKRSASFVRRSGRAMKDLVRGWYGAGVRFVRIPKVSIPALSRFKMPRFKVPRLKWPWKK